MKNGKGKIILLLIISIISITKVNALNIKNGNFVVSTYDSNENGSFFYNDLNFGTNIDKTFTITGGNNLQGYDYVTFGLTLQYSHTMNISETTTGQNNTFQADNGNLIYFCSHYTNRSQTYADGTTSTISVCDNWTLDIDNPTIATENEHINENTTGNISYNPNIQFAIYSIYDNGSYSMCSVEHTDYGTSLVTCQVSDGATTINSIRIRNVGSVYYAGIYGRFGITAYHTFIKDPNKEVITNNNTNAQNIINNNTQNAQDIQNGINNADYNGQTEQPNTTSYDDYKQKEQTLENISQADMSSVNVGLDYTASSWIWTLINRIINVNSIIMSFYITILSIGVIKLIMRR